MLAKKKKKSIFVYRKTPSYLLVEVLSGGISVEGAGAGESMWKRGTVRHENTHRNIRKVVRMKLVPGSWVEMKVHQDTWYCTQWGGKMMTHWGNTPQGHLVTHLGVWFSDTSYYKLSKINLTVNPLMYSKSSFTNLVQSRKSDQGSLCIISQRHYSFHTSHISLKPFILLWTCHSSII